MATADASTSVTDGPAATTPPAKTEVTPRVVPSTVTVNALVGAVAEDSTSLNVSSTFLPSFDVFGAPSPVVTSVGATKSTLFVTVCAAKVAASLPPASCTAFASSLAVGSM